MVHRGEKYFIDELLKYEVLKFASSAFGANGQLSHRINTSIRPCI